MSAERDPMLHWGSGIVALGALGLLAAAAAILPRQIEPGARIGRHLVAGGLAIVSLSVVLVLIALIPLRRGEKSGPSGPPPFRFSSWACRS